VKREFGRCFACRRILPVYDKLGRQILFQVVFYDGHLREGAMHHKLICVANGGLGFSRLAAGPGASAEISRSLKVPATCLSPVSW